METRNSKSCEARKDTRKLNQSTHRNTKSNKQANIKKKKKTALGIACVGVRKGMEGKNKLRYGG